MATGWISRSALLMLSAAMTACELPAAKTPAQIGQYETPQPKVVPERPRPEELTTLAGEWRIAGIDGQSLDEPVALALTGDARQLWWVPRCAGLVRNYRIQGTSIAFGPTDPTQPAGSPTPPVCAIGRPARLGDVARALDHATTITKTASNGVFVSGPNHSVTLFSQ